MLLYFEFEEKRHKADVTWPKKDENIVVQINDSELSKHFPTDFYFETNKGKVSFIIEDKDNKRLLELQTIISRRLQEFVNKV